MLEIKEKYLPIGTVVLLEGGTQAVMIFGFCSVANDSDGTVYDYCGCLYPDGLMSSDEILLFNHDSIVQVYHYGYEDNDEIAYKQRLKEAMNQ